MRDPARIPLIWTAFERAHAIYPDWRFGQFLSNFLGWYGRDPFFPEDDDWLKIIDQYIAKAGMGAYDPKWEPKAAKSKKPAKSQKSASKPVKPKTGVTTQAKKKAPKKQLKTQKKAGSKNG